MSTTAPELYAKLLGMPARWSSTPNRSTPGLVGIWCNFSQAFTFTHLALRGVPMHVIETERAAEVASRAAANRLVF